MARFEINEEGLDKLLGDVQKKTNEAVRRGERAAVGKSPDQVADAVASELRRIGVEPDVTVLRQQYRKTAGGAN